MCFQRHCATLVVCGSLVIASGCAETSDESADAAPAAPPRIEDSTVVVSVNGDQLMRSKLDKQISRIVSNPRMAGRSAEEVERARAEIERQLIDHFVARSLLVSRAKTENLVVEDTEVTEAVEQLSGRLPQGRTMETALAADGLTMEKLQEQLRGDLAARKVVEKQVAGIPEATEEEVSSFYEANSNAFRRSETATARHILFSVDAGADETAKAEKRKLAEECCAKLQEGADFAKLAEEHSGCNTGKRSGGDLGTFERGRMVKPFEDAAFSQEIGKVGPVVETQFGFHIIEVTGRSEAGTTPLAEVKDQIAERITNQKRQQAAKTYVDALKAKAVITYGQ